MGLTEEKLPPGERPEVFRMVVNHQVALDTVFPPAKDHLPPGNKREKFVQPGLLLGQAQGKFGGGRDDQHFISRMQVVQSFDAAGYGGERFLLRPR